MGVVAEAIKTKMVLPTEKRKADNTWVNQKFLMLGQGGVGKSHFWSCGERTLFLQTEAGLNHLEVEAVPVHSWDDFTEAGGLLVQELGKGALRWDTLVIDTVDNWVDMANEKVIQDGKEKFSKAEINGIGDIPNGAGWFMASNLIATYLRKLASLPMAIVLIGHHNQKKIKEPTREYDKSTISIGGNMGIQLLHWSDHTLYIEGKMVGDTLKRKVYTLPSQIREGKSRGGIVPNGMEWSDNMQENYKKFRSLFV